MQNSKTTISPKENCIPDYNAKTWLQVIMARFVVLPVLIITLYSCSTTKNQVYFKDLRKDTLLKNIVNPDYEIKIRKNDILGIIVNSPSPDVAFYNGSSGGSTASGSSVSATASPSSGAYPVDQNGNIEFPKLGTLHVEGMTKKQLKDSLQNQLIPYLKESVVSVNFLNRHVTMIGAVTTSVINIGYDNMTLLDALALSGDIGEKGRTDNILVIRDTGGVKAFKRLNLQDYSIFSSPYFYVQPNDIVYVEPKVPRTPLSPIQVISLVTGAASILTILITVISKL